jgi:predicted dehydrogenase
MVRVAVIGAGNVGGIRCQVIRESPDSEVGIVADLDWERARALARTCGAEASNDPLAAIKSSNVDAVVICTPTKFHAGLACAALRAGKHVLCEKPLTRSLAEADEILEAVPVRRLVLKTGFNYRYMANVRQAKQIIDAGALGPLHFLRCRYGHGGRPNYEQHWCTDLELSGGGVLIEQGIHILDLTRYLLGEPVAVSATTSRSFWNFPAVEDNCFLTLTTARAQTAQLHISWTQWINLLDLEIFGHDGYLLLSGRDGHYGPQKLVWGKRRSDHSRPEEESFTFPAANDSWSLEWQDFVTAIQDGHEPMGHIGDSLRALELVEAAYTSARERRWVDVASVDEQVESIP